MPNWSAGEHDPDLGGSLVARGRHRRHAEDEPPVLIVEDVAERASSAER
jgi:hypothetical protein